MVGLYFGALLLLVLTGFFLVRSRATAMALSVSGAGAGNRITVHSLPLYHGLLAATLVLFGMLAVYSFATPMLGQYAHRVAMSNLPVEFTKDALTAGATYRDIQNIASGAFKDPPAPVKAAADIYQQTKTIGGYAILAAGLLAALGGIAFAFTRVSPTFRARNIFERFVLVFLWTCATVAVLTTIGIVASVLYETLRFFFDPSLKGRPGVTEFLFGTEWNPQAAMRADQGEIKTAYGFLPLLTGTLLITVIAIAVAGPLGLMSAIFLAEYASPRVRAYAKPILEILAGIPTVVLGFFAALTVAPII
ncbi:MAG: phosphate ABC transporter permease family protein, partial [Hyphomicrobiaceae bacterium]|nr:phosphate ABC transporter permease family protein [Hyphomicrobiaceae bacterium]